MHRSFPIIAALCLCGDWAQARTTQPAGTADRAKTESAAEPRPRTRRVLFRSDSPRLFAPQPARPSATPIPAARPDAAKPATLVLRTPAKPSPALPAPRPVTTRLAPAPATSLSRGRSLDFQPTSFTPYDAYLGTVKSVISRLDSHGASMVTACELMREGRQFRYLATDPYRAQPPAVTGARHAGDCKSKALWLYDQLGDPSAFYVIGKLERRARASHAWVYWRYAGQWWILDPTDRSSPVAADSISPSRYVPYYSYSRAGAFRHSATRLMLAGAGGIPAVPAVAVQARAGTSRGSRE